MIQVVFIKKVDVIKRKHKIQNIVRLDAMVQTQEEVLQEMDSISIFDEAKMICLEHCTFLSSKNTTHYDIESFLKRNGEDGYVLVLICESAKLDQRKKAVKQLMEISTVYSCIALDEQSQRSYIQEHIKKEQLHMDADALRWFCQRVGLDAMRIDSEIYKLKTYGDVIHLEDVQALVTPEPVNDVFKMVDALFSKNGVRLLAFLSKLSKTEYGAGSNHRIVGITGSLFISGSSLHGSGDDKRRNRFVFKGASLSGADQYEKGTIILPARNYWIS